MGFSHPLQDARYTFCYVCQPCNFPRLCYYKNMDVLNTVFGGKTHVRIMRLFLLNPDRVYELSAIESASAGTRRMVLRELAAFEKAGLVKRKKFYKEGTHKRIPAYGWTLNNSFMYLVPLRNMLVNGVILHSRNVAKRLSRGGTLKLVVLAGIFIHNWDNRVDLLVVGDKLRKGILKRVMHSMESEIGRELHYSILTTADFQYRLSIGDRLVRDVFDFPHQIILNKGIIAE